MGPTKLVSSSQVRRKLVKGIEDLWENSLFFDYTLKVEEKSIPVHKMILASCSRYFRAMFNSSMKESSQASVELKGLKSTAVKSVINLIYTGDIELSADTLDDVLSAAHYLQIHSAVEVCSAYLLEDMTWETVSHVQHLAQIYDLDDVKKEVEDFMLTSFSEMPDEAVECVGKQVLKLVTSKDLNVNSEYKLFEKLLLFKTILSEDEFYEALSSVRFPLMSKDELEKVSSSGVMTTRLSHLMDEAWEYHKDVIKQPLLQTERTQVRLGKMATVFADYTSITGVFEDNEPKDISISEPLYYQNFRCIFLGLVSVGNFLYVCVQTRHTCLLRYDPRSNLWQELRGLIETQRNGPQFVAYEKQIFAIGGQGTKTIEIYDIETNEWRYGADVNYNNYLSVGVTLGDNIYVCGGEGDEYSFEGFFYSDSLSCYDPANDTWQFKAPMFEKRTSHKGLAFDKKLFIFGGISPQNIHFNVEYYSPDVDQWTVMHSALSFEIDGVCSSGSDIYFLMRQQQEDEEKSFKMTVSFQKFNLETATTEDELVIEVIKTVKFGHYKPPFMCSTLVLPSKLRR